MNYVVYLHGFNSVPPTGEKLEAIKQAFPTRTLITPHIKWDENPTFDVLPIMEVADSVLIIGTSLGGGLALKIASECMLPCIAINPSLDPSKRLVGTYTDPNSRTYEITEKELARIKANELTIGNKICLRELGRDVAIFVGGKDEIVDPIGGFALARDCRLMLHFKKDMAHRPTIQEFRDILTEYKNT